ncbi:hypothetical protein N7451_006549 [Penicillium sp. IBT 35674x]|nr:hypothetical protein N7451_006549 [Penicillium sp. IBT 35674x]
MAEVSPEQLNSLRGNAHLYNQQPATTTTKQSQETDSALPKGVVLDKDGKPCRTCTSVSSWRALTKQAKADSPTSSSNTTSTTPATSTTPTTPLSAPTTHPEPSVPADCPPDVEALGRSTWTLLHTMAATYPEKADTQQQSDMQGFLKLFSRLYPCWVCADDFKTWMAHPSGRNQPKLSGRKEFGWWMCEAHNEVNRKLGKKEFDCRFWEERWKTGWKDGRCD